MTSANVDRDLARPLIPLDGIAYGIDGLEALLVIHLGDAHVHASFVRAGEGPGRAPLLAGDLASVLRDTYRAAQAAARRLPPGAGAAAARRSSRPPHDRAADLLEPVVTLEIDGTTVLLRRVRAYVVACAFDATMPLGMGRLVAARLAATLAHELPRGDAPEDISLEDPGRATPQPRSLPSAPPRAHVPSVMPPPPRASWAEVDRTRRLLALLDARAPEPHVARLRVALRAGLTPLALEHLEALGAEAMLLIETAVEDVLGLDRSSLRRLA